MLRTGDQEELGLGSRFRIPPSLLGEPTVDAGTTRCCGTTFAIWPHLEPHEGQRTIVSVTVRHYSDDGSEE